MPALPPLPGTRKKGERPLQTKETSNLKQHYIIHAAGIYGSHQYADLALIMKTNSKGKLISRGN
ncbi:hypothetical protein LCGC14_2705040 [marine sediment metagenome]|uniref:Uncharacterized protein n=1 Tax=marine sediment metagenome TaxID=412755 RepID=A0A0F9BNR1_9ZZZZ